MAKIPGTHIPAELKNLAINGGFDFFQRIEGNTTTISGSTSGVAGYTADMWLYTSGGSNGKSYTLARSTNVPSQAQSGFQSTYSLLFTNTVVGGFATSDYYEPLQYRMEGLDYIKIHAKTATFGFWFNPSLAGTYSFALRNGSLNRSYVTTFSASAGWQFITMSIPMDTSAGGTWNFDNTVGLIVDIGGISGATYSTSVLGSWQTGNYVAASTATNYVATAGNTLAIAQFSIVEGPLGFSATGFQRAGKDIQQELAMCQRYYEKSYDIGTVPGTSGFTSAVAAFRTSSFSRNGLRMMLYYKSNKRIAATLTIYNPNVSNGAGFYYDSDTGASTVATVAENGTTMADITGPAASNTTSTGNDRFHWTADAGL